jgi:hypothetical protein
MKTIHKFSISIVDEQTVQMPVGALILSIQVQRGQPCVWAMVDTDQSTHARKFYLVGTGHPCEHVNGCKYVGTFQTQEGGLVFHLFDFGYTDTATRWPV